MSSTKKTKIVFVHDGPVFFDGFGNYYEFAYHELWQRYSYLADEVFFLMRIKPIDPLRKFTLLSPQIRVVDVPDFKSPRKILKKRPMAKRIIEDVIKECDYAVLRLPSSNAQVAIKYIKKYNKPYIVESVGCSWDSYWYHGFLGKMVAPYMFLKDKQIIANAPYVYYVTTKFLQSRYPTKGKTVCCSNVVLDKLDDSTLDKRLEKLAVFEAAGPQRKIILGTAAAIDTRYKGQEHVIRAIPELVRRGYDVEYHLAGGIAGQKDSAFLKGLAEKYGVSNRVVFVGSLAANQMNEYYDSLDIYIQPSKQEGLPRAVIEAMSRGCPVLGTRVAGIPELIQEECLFKKNSDSEVVAAVERIMKTDLKKMARENFEMARQYEREKLEVRRKEFYDGFLKEQREQ